MKQGKFLLAALTVVLVAGFVGVAAVSADDSTPEPPFTGRGHMGQSNPDRAPLNLSLDGNILHDSMMVVLAEGLDMTVAELEARIDGGEYVGQIALDAGFTIEEFQALLADARSAAVEQAVADGLLTEEQAEWMANPGMRGNKADGTTFEHPRLTNPDCDLSGDGSCDLSGIGSMRRGPAGR